MKELCTVKGLDLTVNNKPRIYTEEPSELYPSNFNYAALSRWLARWYKCFCYSPKVRDSKK